MAPILTTFAWLIPVPPLLAFFLILLVFKRNKTASFGLAWLAIITSLVLSWSIVQGAVAEFAAHPEEVDHHPQLIHDSVVWMPFGEYTSSGCETCLEMGVSVDPLTVIMLFMVPFAVFMIFMYSVGYHNYGQPEGHHLGEPNHGKEEPLFSRFFAFMCLFAAGMLTLLVADNLLLLFVGWEVMGLCSYLLIGFWYARTYEFDPKNPQKLPPRKASIKAFMTTRVADVVMLLGIVFFYRVFGTLNFHDALSSESLIHASQHTIMGLSGGVGLSIIALLLFTGTVGKSAQWPLHVWLPNAMEGPTPVSAVIHAAAMVSAGIYMLLRIFPLIAVGINVNPTAGWIIAGIGAFTALMAATIAVAQDDVKGVLAYSTISQLGFMVAAIGIGAYIAAAFHLITHAFFKALLFLGSGSVIHGMEHGAEHVHDHHTDPQDMLNMGGLKDKMPITFWTFLIGGFALSGFPIVTAGFWSKDEIFADAWLVGAVDGKAIGFFVFAMLCLAALLTAFYTMRQISLTFLGKPRTPLAEHAHESNWYMTLPLVLLSFFAVAAGWVGIPDDFLGTSGVFYNYFHHFVGATLHEPIADLYKADLVAHKIQAPPFNIVPVAASILVALGGLGAGYSMYGHRPLKAGEEDPLKKMLGPVHTFLMNKWYWDEIYQTVFINPIKYFSENIVYQWIDKGLIDGFIHLVASAIYGLGRIALWLENLIFDDAVDAVKDGFLWVSREFRSIQTGKIQEYALISTLIAGALAFVVLYISGAFQGLFG